MKKDTLDDVVAISTDIIHSATTPVAYSEVNSEIPQSLTAAQLAVANQMEVAASAERAASTIRDKEYQCVPLWVPETYKGCTLNITFSSYPGSSKSKITTESNVANALPFVMEESTVPHATCPCVMLPADHLVCPCVMPVDPIDPVYNEATLICVGVGFNRSKIIICNTDNMLNEQPGEEECPNRASEYIIHINRITENFPRKEDTL